MSRALADDTPRDDAGPQETVRLVEPHQRWHDAWLAARREWGPGRHEDGFALRPDDTTDTLATPDGFAEWVAWQHTRPARIWWIVRGDDVLGGIVLRPEAQHEGRVTGHVGYGIRPSARRQGLATWALTEVLRRARAAGMPGCLLVCADTNAASIRTIERCGGILQARVEDEHALSRHYWIPCEGP